MNEIIFIKKTLVKPLIAAKAMVAKPVQLVAALPLMAVPAMTTEYKALILLFILFWVDFGTGIGASYVEFYKELPPKEPGAPKRYVIKSAKLKMSAVKFIIYGLCLLIAKGVQLAFIPTEFVLHDQVNAMTLTVIAAAFLCSIEVYSIVFENFKRMGFDVLQVVGKAVKKYKSVKKEIEDEA